MAHIVLADDDSIVIDILRDAFERNGHTLGAASDGAQALSALADNRPDLLILDCEMPVMPGMEALREIRNSPEFYGLPVLILTAHDARSGMLTALREGADGYVRKPFDPEYLVHRAETLLFERGALRSRPQTPGGHLRRAS